MDDVTLEVTDADHGLRDRLNAEIIAFNKAANYAAACTAGLGAAAATSICSGSAKTSAGAAWAASS